MRWLMALLVAACASTKPLDPSTMDDATFDRELAARFQYGPPEPEPAEVSRPKRRPNRRRGLPRAIPRIRPRVHSRSARASASAMLDAAAHRKLAR
jgi:hypothetical protein